VNLTSTLIDRLTALKSLLDLGDVELVSVASSRLAEHQHEPAIQEIQAALADHRYAEAVRMIEKLLSDAYPKFIGIRAGEERNWEIAPGVNMTFCWCPPGEFLMGSPETEYGRRKDEKQVYATFTRGFWMAKTQVTQKQWIAIMGDNPSYNIGDNLPVEQVCWDDMCLDGTRSDSTQEFLRKLNAKIDNTDVGKMVLPTEAQWEYACRAGELGSYSGGTIDEVAWYEYNSKDKTHPVGMKKPNAWGLHDMHGNVWEWCADWWGDKILGGVDPSGPDSGMFRVLRGGGWRAYAIGCRAAFRYDHGIQGTRDYDIGFRVTRISVP
jgi:formylglycine-generating enzyme required for sulfatase activity